MMPPRDLPHTVAGRRPGHARAGGLGDVSLRSLAAAVGTSHRMLLHHFGSREGLVAAVVAAIGGADQ